MRLTLISLLIAVVLGVLLGAVMGFTPKEKTNCVNIYYDVVDEAGTLRAHRMVNQLKVLLKSFPQFMVRESAVNDYQSGDIAQCAASIYIGSSFDNHLPSVFLDDFVEAKTNVAWLGYNIWQLGSQLEDVFGYRYVRITTDDFHLRDPRGRPTFFKEIFYKGAKYTKYGELVDGRQSPFLAPFSQVELVQSTFDRSEVLAEVKHSGTKEMIPYILRSHNHYYVADVPLAYIYDSDRYRIFTDLLADILNGRHTREKPLAKRNVGLIWDDLMKVEF